MIRLASPEIDDDDIASVSAVLRTGHLVQGGEVKAFERELGEFVGGGHVVAVSNCTSALHLSLLALGASSGDGIIVPAFSWPATANVVAGIGAKPVFVDIDDVSFAMRPDALQAALQRVSAKAIIPVHPFGEMAPLERICQLAADAHVPIIEDAACALGSADDGRVAGRWGLMGCYSFHPRKAITTGEGGAVVTDDARLARTIRALRNHGQDPEATGSDFILPGFNQRLTEFQAALGRSQLRKLERLVSIRRQLADTYSALLADTPIQVPAHRSPTTHVYQSYVILIPTELAPDRDRIISAMRESGIEVSIGTHHIPMTRYYRETYGHRMGDFPVTDSVASRAIALPLHPRLSADDQALVVSTLRRFVA